MMAAEFVKVFAGTSGVSRSTSTRRYRTTSPRLHLGASGFDSVLTRIPSQFSPRSNQGMAENR
jgi:hypothetical protein